jgi:hypothetical protein
MAISTRDRRALIVFGAIVVVAVGAYFLLLKPHAGKTTPQARSTTPAAGSTSPAPAPSTSSRSTPRTPPPVFAPGAKDPFSPLVNPSGGGGPSTTGASPPPPTTPPASTPPPTHEPSVSPPASPSSVPPGGTGTHVAGHTVVLLDIFVRNGVDKAQVEVDGKAYTVTEGDTFADGFELVSIGGTCATFQHGGQQFVLCENPHK